jgi:hypothetical protein
MPNRELPPPIVKIPPIFETTPMDIAMIAHSREAIQRSLRILSDSRRLASYPLGHDRDHSFEHCASDAVESPAEGPKK